MLEIHFILTSFIFFIIIYMTIKLVDKVREFRINNYIKLKLEDGRTIIYVNNRRFRQCMYLLLNIPVDRIEDYDEIDSIDEAAERLDRSMERRHGVGIRISPEEEFMGHCSNLQAWVENGYDTRILHRNLAFPLLKRLTAVGDPLAKKVFKEEIAIRYASGHPTVITFLTHNGYLKYLNAEEFESIFEELNLHLLEGITSEFKNALENMQNVDSKKSNYYLINNLLRNFGIQHIPLIISHIIKEIPENFRENLIKTVYEMFKTRNKFPLLQFLNYNLKYFNDFDFDFVRYNKKLVGIFKDNKLYLSGQNIQNVTDIEGLKDKYVKIKELDLSDNQIKEIKGLENFLNLEFLKLNNNQITQINGLEQLKNIEKLTLRNNRISEIKGLDNLSKLKYLDLSGNININEIPESLNDIHALETLKLWNCNIKKFSDSTSKFFWMEQNYRYYSGYTQKDKEYYEKTHNRKASYNNKLYKHFVQWAIKMRKILLEQKFTYRVIEKFENNTSKNAIWSGKPTNAFIKWLDDRKQTRITDFN